MTLDELVSLVKTRHARIIASARYRAPETKFSLKEPAGGYATPADGRLHAAYCFAAQATALAVNRTTGKVIVRDVFIACDAGRMINPAAVEGQMEGGVVMGLGYALSEEYREDQGIVKTDSFGKLGLMRIGQSTADPLQGRREPPRRWTFRGQGNGGAPRFLEPAIGGARDSRGFGACGSIRFHHAGKDSESLAGTKRARLEGSLAAPAQAWPRPQATSRGDGDGNTGRIGEWNGDKPSRTRAGDTGNQRIYPHRAPLCRLGTLRRISLGG